MNDEKRAEITKMMAEATELEPVEISEVMAEAPARPPALPPAGQPTKLKLPERVRERAALIDRIVLGYITSVGLARNLGIVMFFCSQVEHGEALHPPGPWVSCPLFRAVDTSLQRLRKARKIKYRSARTAAAAGWVPTGRPPKTAKRPQGSPR
jgi:hypothetical protein